MTLCGVSHTLLTWWIELLAGYVDQFLVSLALQDEAHLKLFFAEFGVLWLRCSALVSHTKLSRAHLGLIQVMVTLALGYDYCLSSIHWWHTNCKRACLRHVHGRARHRMRVMTSELLYAQLGSTDNAIWFATPTHHLRRWRGSWRHLRWRMWPKSVVAPRAISLHILLSFSWNEFLIK